MDMKSPIISILKHNRRKDWKDIDDELIEKHLRKPINNFP